MKYIIQLQDGCWVAPWPGDPGRTIVVENAKRYKSYHDASHALSRIKNYYPFRCFPESKIIEVTE